MRMELPDQKALDDLSVFSTGSTGRENMKRVDLRAYLPPIGNQGKRSSCTAWATGYGLKGLQEVLDQRWKANSSSRQFNPMFVYNSINKGKDNGSSIMAALNLLKNYGCATFSDCKISTDDYWTKPSGYAFLHAKKYRIASYGKLNSKKAIKRALSMGYPVVIGARLTALFMPGKFNVYSKKQHDYGMRTRDTSLKHARHAMLVVGYDDYMQAFLIMNSWGKNWGNKGYCWVDYKLMVPDAQRYSNQFLFVAYAAMDIPIKVNGDSTKTVLNIKKIPTRYIGISERTGNPCWLWKAYLDGDRKTMSNIKYVKWITKNNVSSAKNWSLKNGFSGQGHFATAGLNYIKCEVHYKNGGISNPVKVQFKCGRNKSNYSFFSEANNRYWGYNQKTRKHIWQIKLNLDTFANSQELSEVDYVKYSIFDGSTGNRFEKKSSDSNSRFKVWVTLGYNRKPGSYKPKSIENPDWGNSTSGKHALAITTTVVLKDGNYVKLKKHGYDFSMLANIQKSCYLNAGGGRKLDSTDGKSLTGWNAFVTGPGHLMDRIKSVTYKAGKWKRTVPFNKKHGFPISLWTGHDCWLYAYLNMTNGEILKIKTDITVSGWKLY